MKVAGVEGKFVGFKLGRNFDELCKPIEGVNQGLKITIRIDDSSAICK